MSFDLKIYQGDLAIGTDGDVAVVRDSEKLVQDVLKFLMTPLGGNPFFAWYGSTLSDIMIGNPYDTPFVSSIAEGQIRAGIETIQNLQREQIARQYVSAAELIAVLKELRVFRNPINPTFFTISLTILSKALKSTTTEINVSI